MWGQKPFSRLSNAGFTLMELIIVIIILGAMSLGIAGFIKLSTQTYLNVTERDELLANARFSVERLNREVRNALPNSIRVRANGGTSATKRCLEFVPIIASTTYLDIPVPPKVASNTASVIPLGAVGAGNYVCNSCGDNAIVYPLNTAEVYTSYSGTTGKAFSIKQYTDNEANTPAVLTFDNAVSFTETSPTQRLYLFNGPVSYCLQGDTLTRYVGYDVNATQPLPPFSHGSSSLMAGHLDFSTSSFTVQEPSLRRNAVVQVNFNFVRDGEQVIFDNAIHITNIP